MPSYLEPSTSNYDDLGNGDNGTIGSRLRKRRRTGSSPSETTPPAPRTSNSLKIPSPNSKCTTDGVALQEASQNAPQGTTVQHAPEKAPQPGTPLSTPNNASDAPPEDPVVLEPRTSGGTGQSHTSQEAPSEPKRKPRDRQAYTSVTPDLAAVIARIIDHGEHIDNHYAAQGYDNMGIVDTESFLPLGASLHLKTQSLPILDNLVGCSVA